MKQPSDSRHGSTDNYEQLGAMYKRILMLEMALALRQLECRMLLGVRSRESLNVKLSSSVKARNVGSTSHGSGPIAPGVEGRS